MLAYKCYQLISISKIKSYNILQIYSRKKRIPFYYAKLLHCLRTFRNVLYFTLEVHYRVSYFTNLKLKKGISTEKYFILLSSKRRFYFCVLRKKKNDQNMYIAT